MDSILKINGSLKGKLLQKKHTSLQRNAKSRLKKIFYKNVKRRQSKKKKIFQLKNQGIKPLVIIKNRFPIISKHSLLRKKTYPIFYGTYLPI